MAEELRDDQRCSLLAFLARYADMHGEMIYDDIDCYCFSESYTIPSASTGIAHDHYAVSVDTRA